MSSSPNLPLRRSRWPLWCSGLLLLLFAALVAHQVHAKKTRVFTAEQMMQQLSSAEFLDDMGPTGSAAQEWPQWRGQRRDGVAHTGPLAPWPDEGLKKLWQVEGGDSYSSFAVTGGRFYTQFASNQDDKQVSLCLDAETGKEIWRETYDRPKVSIEYGNWPRSSPVIDAGQLFTVDQGGRFQCRKAVSGELLWEHDLLEEYGGKLPRWGVTFSPLVVGDLVVTVPGGKKDSTVVAFDRNTGKEKWKALSNPPGYSSPIAITVGGRQQVVVFTGDSVAGLALKDGASLWSYPWATDFQVNAATPIVFRTKSGQEEQQYVFITSGYDKGCALLRIEVNDQNKFTPQPVFENNRLCSHFSSPVRYRDHVYGFNETELTCLSLRTGEVSGKDRETGWPKRGYKKGTLLLIEPSQGKPRLLVLSEEGKLALVDANPDEFHLEGEFKPLRRRCWPMPAVAEGKIYLRDEQNIVCLKLPLEEKTASIFSAKDLGKQEDREKQALPQNLHRALDSLLERDPDLARLVEAWAGLPGLRRSRRSG